MQDRTNIVGIWRLIAFEAEQQTTGEKVPLMGENPNGYAIFTNEGRAMFVLTGEGRKAPKNDQDRADLFNSLVAYTGLYRFEGDKWITKVDVAGNPEWIGTEQDRFFEVTGNRLQVMTPWTVAPNWPEKGVQRGLLTFERAKSVT
jgi:hypothetical protein